MNDAMKDWLLRHPEYPKTVQEFVTARVLPKLPTPPLARNSPSTAPAAWSCWWTSRRALATHPGFEVRPSHHFFPLLSGMAMTSPANRGDLIGPEKCFVWHPTQLEPSGMEPAR